MSPWAIEDIPSADGLYVRFLVQHFDESNRKLYPNFFRPHGGPRMSSDWNRYATPTDTRNAPNKTGRPAESYGIAELSVAAVREIDGMSVVHTPIIEVNRAHTDILGLSRDDFDTLVVTIRRELMVTTVNGIHFLPGQPSTR